MKRGGVLLVLGIALALAAPAQAVQTITLVNAAHVSSQAVARLELALVVQVNRDIGPIWHTPHIAFGQGGWTLTLTNAKQLAPGLGGYHAIGEGMPPSATVYVKANGDSWTMLASHELIEMLVDPSENRYLAWKLVEVCDPVYNVYYMIHGVEVTDFVTPAWFYAHSRGPWDFERSLR